MTIVQRVVASFKAFALRFPLAGRSWYLGGLGGTRFDYQGRSNPSGNAIVQACVLWLARTFPEAPMRVRLMRRNGDLDQQPDHPLLKVLATPNPYYSGALLWMATLADWVLTGNAYWFKVRSGGGRVTELWWLPSRMVEPKFPDDGSQFLTHYEYAPNGAPTRLRVEDVVHFRYGLDPDNPRKGLSPFASLVREIYTDDEAANFTASLLRNLGVPGVVVAPDTDVSPSQADLERIKSDFSARFGGDNRGAPLVMSGKTKVTVVSFSPEQMNLKGMRRLPEERVTAVLGIPAIVVGLGAGLDRSTFANYEEARQAAYEGNVIPTQRLFAAELSTQLLPDFGDPARLVLDFDLSEVRVLQPDLDKLFVRLNVGVQGGWITPNEAREEIGMDALPGGDVIYVPGTVTPTDVTDLIPEPVAPPMAALPDPNAPPAPLLALPPGKGRRDTKAHGENLADALHRVRARHQVSLERQLARFLWAQRGRVVGALAAQQKAFEPLSVNGFATMTNLEAKGINWRDIFDAISEEKGLRGLLEKWYTRVLGSVHSLTEDSLGVSFELDDPATRAYLVDAGALIKDITEHTRNDIARALQEGQAAGEGIPQIAKRIEELTAFNGERAVTIARTELASASQHAAIASYRASGVVTHVTVFDGTDDDDACRTANGQTWTLDEASKRPLEHPRCRRAFGAVVGDAASEAAA